MSTIEITVDDGGVTAALRLATLGLPAVARDAVKDTASSLQKTMRADAQGHSPAIARSITTEMSGNAVFSEAKVGPVKGGAGSLANIAYFGGTHGGGGTVRDPQLAANEVADGFVASLTNALGGLVL